MNLIEKGKSTYVIVYGKDSSSCERNAAFELQKYLKTITGVELKVITDETASVDEEIIIGHTNREKEGQFDRRELGEEGFIIKPEGTKLWLVGGGDRGTLYCVYTFLEEQLGCRYYTETIEKIPAKDTIAMSELKEDKQIPILMFRDAAWYDYFSTGISVKQKINAPIWGRELPEEVGGGITYCKGMGGHTFEELIPPSEYFESHPEYFTMNDKGERVPDKQLCLTNPEVLELVIAGVRKWLSEEPDTKIISVSQNDYGGPCLCENCRKVYEEEGGAYSGAVIRFVNRVAEAIKDEYPNVWVDTYAYSYTRSAPKFAKPASNVMVRLCTMGTCFSHEKENAICDTGTAATYVDGTYNSFTKDINDWAKISKALFVYDYTCNYQHWSLTFPDWSNLRKNIRYYVESNAIGLEMQGNQLSSSIEFSDLRAYLLAKLMWNPYMSEEEYSNHMDDFLIGVYGPGGCYIRKYMELAEEITKDLCFDLITGPYNMYPLFFIENHRSCEIPGDLTYEMLTNYKEVDWEPYWNWNTDIKECDITVKGTEWFAKAMDLAETETQRTQIDRIFCQVEYIKSYYLKKRLNVGKEGFAKMLMEYVRNYPDHVIDVEGIVKVAWEQLEEKYVAYNRRLAERMVAHGVTYLWEGLSFEEFDWKTFDYSAVPMEWPKRAKKFEVC